MMTNEDDQDAVINMISDVDQAALVDEVRWGEVGRCSDAFLVKLVCKGRLITLIAIAQLYTYVKLNLHLIHKSIFAPPINLLHPHVSSL